MKTIVGARLQQFSKPGSMGAVNDTRYIRCFWPGLDQPTALFAEGSSGIEVIGPPTPRNVVFPKDTVFPEYHPDAVYPAELAVLKAGAKAIINLSDEHAEIYQAAYDEAVAKLPKTAATHQTRADCHFLVHNELVSSKDEKPRYERYVALLSKDEAASLVDEAKSVEALKIDAIFVKTEQSFDDPATVYHKVVDGKMVDVTADLEALAEPVSSIVFLAVELPLKQ